MWFLCLELLIIVSTSPNKLNRRGVTRSLINSFVSCSSHLPMKPRIQSRPRNSIRAFASHYSNETGILRFYYRHFVAFLLLSLFLPLSRSLFPSLSLSLFLLNPFARLGHSCCLSQDVSPSFHLVSCENGLLIVSAGTAD